MSLEQTIAAVGFAKVLVRLTPGTSLAVADAAVTEASLENLFVVPDQDQQSGLEAVAGGETRTEPGLQPRPRRVRLYPLLGLATGYVNHDGLAGLRERGEVDRVVEAQIPSLIRPHRIGQVQPFEDPEPAMAAVQLSWGIRRLRANALWDQGLTGTGVIVGHLDTGVDVSGPELRSALHAFAEFDRAGDRIEGATARDSDTHGTHTAGTIVGRAGPRGAFGVAPGAKLASAMVIEGGEVVERILGGMEWVIEQGAHVLSMSLGLRGFSPAFEVLISALRQREILPVIAVGNEGPQSSRSPGNYSNVLSIGAMDALDRVPSFSSSQRFQRPSDPLVPDMVAPGVAVLSCVPGGYLEMDGSSMATPHIAGLAALLMQARPDVPIARIEAAILQSCSLPGGMPAPRANRGVPDAVRALALLQQMP